MVTAVTKRPLHPNGGTPVEDADMPVSDLDTRYQPDASPPRVTFFEDIKATPALPSRVITLEDTPELPAIVQNGDAEQ